MLPRIWSDKRQNSPQLDSGHNKRLKKRSSLVFQTVKEMGGESYFQIPRLPGRPARKYEQIS